MASVATRTIGWAKTDTFQAQNANQGRGLAVTLGGSGDNYVATAGANAVCIGIQNEITVAAGDPVSVTELGDATAIAGAAVACNVFLKSNAAGQLIPITTAADNIIAKSKSSAAALGDELIVLVIPSVN